LKFLAGVLLSALNFAFTSGKLRTQPAYLREQVFTRDRGICSSCAVDTIREARRLQYARGANRTSLLAHWGLRNSRKSLWDADHIIPVIEGGDKCALQNIRTMCLRCHRQATLQLRQRKRLQDLRVSTK
jgi:5-methylcytosine-specific restriction enzyme A